MDRVMLDELAKILEDCVAICELYENTNAGTELSQTVIVSFFDRLRRVREAFKEVSEGLPKNALPTFNPKPLAEITELLDRLSKNAAS